MTELQPLTSVPEPSKIKIETLPQQQQQQQQQQPTFTIENGIQPQKETQQYVPSSSSSSLPSTTRPTPNNLIDNTQPQLPTETQSTISQTQAQLQSQPQQLQQQPQQEQEHHSDDSRKDTNNSFLTLSQITTHTISFIHSSIHPFIH
jgi:hypothetical protein